MKTLKIFVAVIFMMLTTSGMGFAQGMVYQTHQTMTLAAASGLAETWVLLSDNDKVRVTTASQSVTIESAAGWTQVIAHVNSPCIAEYNDTLWCAMSQIGGNSVTINGTTHPAPPSGVTYTLLVKLDASGNILGSWQAIGAMLLTNIAVKDNGEIAVGGSAGENVAYLSSPNGGAVVVIHNGITDWDNTKGFFIETPSGGSRPLVTSLQYLPNGNLAIAGYTSGGTVSFGGILLPPHGATDGFRGEITSTGTGIQAVQMASSGNDEHHLQITKAGGGFMVTGTYTHPITFYNADGSAGGSLGQFPTNASHDHIYFAYYNASGIFQNAEVAYSNDAGTDLLVIDLVYGNDAFYAMIGNTNYGTAITPTNTHDEAASITLKFDDTGTPEWSKQFEGISGSGDPGDFGEEILDYIDFHAHVDITLSLKENIDKLIEAYPSLERFRGEISEEEWDLLH